MTIEEIKELEGFWINRISIDDAAFFGWEPYDIDKFSELLQSCLPHVPEYNRTFIDVGCGIGTKCVIAAESGLAAYGIDRVPEFIFESSKIGIVSELADARSWNRYGEFGIVYVNHPLNCGEGCVDEALLEARVHEQMASGAVLLSVNYDLAPGCPEHPANSPCVDDCPEDGAAWNEIARYGRWTAAWVKPLCRILLSAPTRFCLMLPPRRRSRRRALARLLETCSSAA